MVGMNMDRYNHYKISSYLLIGFALLLILAALLTDPQGYMQSPLLMLSATGFIGGAFLFALGGDESIDARLASRLSVQGTSALGHIISDLGGYGAGVFLPPESEGGRIMQFIPIQSDCSSFAADGGRFAHHNGITGILTFPLAASLLEDLKRDSDLVLPQEYSLLMGAIQEVCEDLLSVAGRVDVRREGNTVTFDLRNYLLISGCASLREASPEFCALCPCSICSLIACMITEGLKCEVSLNRVTLDETARSPCMSIRYILTTGTEMPG
ncbi:hypothetical protein [Methanoculleus sp. UBA303]|jgi:hypothetical protein|uniref:hypothetical protein n=1 Tax=Methanoculleus sp. UBA303 TaxID=1915497 RepID=UPI0025DBFBB5|nr:hypothetical protein [Methanoculleus sp. UBA303]